eukprot:scaffold67055_cov16-Prasinocladus_malaysianus.AAC.1
MPGALPDFATSSSHALTPARSQATISLCVCVLARVSVCSMCIRCLSAAGRHVFACRQGCRACIPPRFTHQSRHAAFQRAGLGDDGRNLHALQLLIY